MITNKLTKKCVRGVVKKLLEHIGTDNHAELARQLGCPSKQNLDNLIRQDKIPVIRVINYALKEDIDLACLFGQSILATITEA
mgnify:CR=1 FL=1